MPVEDVFKPRTVKAIDPRAVQEKQEGDDEYWARKAKEAKSRLDYQESQHALQQLDQKPETPFRVSGEVNLGKFDLQEQQRLANEAAAKSRQAMDGEIREERDKRQAAEQALYAERVEGLRRDFTTKIAELNGTIEKLATAPRRDERSILEEFKEQFNTLQTMAKEFGFARTSDGQDPMIQLELAKLSMQQAKDEREFKRQMREDDKRWQIEIQKLQDDREHKRAQVQVQAKRDDMIASFPEHIGAAVARGLVDRGQSTPAPGFARPVQQSQTAAPAGKLATIPCPECKSPIAIAPDTSIATCAMCNSQFQVNRQPGPATEPQIDNQEESA